MESVERNWFVEGDSLKHECELFASITDEISKKGISSEQDAMKVRDLSARLIVIAKKIDASRKEEKQPLVEAQKSIDERYNPLSSMIDEARAVVKTMMMDWLKATNARTIESASGGAKVASIRQTWRARIRNPQAAFRQYSDRQEVIDVLERLASADARAGERSIPGFEIYSVESLA